MQVLQFKKANCKNCYKCVRHCPVKAIEIKDHQARILDEECILCGACTVVCPQNAKEDINEVPRVEELIAQGRTVIATVAPSFSAAFEGCAFSALRAALLQLGFSDARETAEGAHIVKTEYERLLAENPERVMISTCCPTVVRYIERHRPEAIPLLAPVISPMQASAQLIKKEMPNASVVFFGPCVSKKGEAGQGGTDFAVTFDELIDWLARRSIRVERMPENTARFSRMFPVTGGILSTMKKQKGISYAAVDGMQSCMDAIEELLSENAKGRFVEMSSCKGSCIGGPAMPGRRASLAARSAVEAAAGDDPQADFTAEERPERQQYADRRKRRPKPSEAQIAEILRRMGKLSPEDELNCGSCGYATCREKAEAVFFGRAEISMCLPFMKERAESFSETIIQATPNAIITVSSENLTVCQINKAACELFGMGSERDILHAPVSRLFDDYDFVTVIAEELPLLQKQAYLADYGLYLEQTFLYEEQNKLIICIMKDITGSKKAHDRSMKSKISAANMADDIVEKQLRIVHEIASLLGETAAETKLAVAQLKQTILEEENEQAGEAFSQNAFKSAKGGM